MVHGGTTNIINSNLGGMQQCWSTGMVSEYVSVFLCCCLLTGPVSGYLKVFICFVRVIQRVHISFLLTALRLSIVMFSLAMSLAAEMLSVAELVVFLMSSSMVSLWASSWGLTMDT